MRFYGIKMYNFLRFGEDQNSLVFDLTHEQQAKIQNGTLSFDSLYEELKANPTEYINAVKKNSDDNIFSGVVGIAGMTEGSFDSSNGAGKSTIFEAICFACYDRIVRQTANNDKKASAGLSVVTKFDGEYPTTLKESYVEQFFEEDGKIYRLKRGRVFTKTQSNNTPICEFECYTEDDADSLSGHRTRDTKRSVEEVIGDNYDLFVNSVMFGQNDSGKFLTGTDKTRKEMIISLLQLENIVNGCVEIVRSKKKQQNDLVTKIKSQIENIRAMIVKYSDQPIVRESDIEEFFESIVLNIFQNFEDKIKKSRELVQGNEEAIKDILEKIAKLEKAEVITKINSLNEEVKTLQNEQQNKKNKFDEEVKDWRKLANESNDLILVNDSEKLKIKTQREKLIFVKKDYEKIINEFNEEESKEVIDKAEKARNIKPKYDGMLKDAYKKRDVMLQKIASFNAIISSKKKDQQSLEEQLKDVSGNQFICSSCKSVVSRSHIENKIEECKKNIETNENGADKIQEHFDAVEVAIKSIQDRIEKISHYVQLESDMKIKINKYKNAEENLKQINDNLKDYDERTGVLNSKIISLKQKQLDYNKKCQIVEESFKKELELINEKMECLSKEISGLRSDADKINKDISELKRQMDEEVLKQKNTNQQIGFYTKEVESIKEFVTRIKNDEQKLVNELKELQRYVLLEKAFGLDGVQTRIVQKYLPLLNLYIKEYLDILSESRISIKMVINDRGKVDMVIIGGTADAYDMLSGGEKMIVRLAVDIGLALLSFSRSAKKPDMICLDEIFGPLDNNHTELVFKMLAELNKKFGKVFLISHKSEIQSLVKNNIIIEKSFGNHGVSKIAGVGDILD